MTSRFYMIACMLLSLMFIDCGCNAQTPTAKKEMTEQEKMMEEMAKSWVAQFDIKLDEMVFNKHQMGSYTSDKYDKAAIMVIIFPGTLEETVANEKNKEPKEGQTIISKGIETINGKEMYVSKEKVTREDLTLAFQHYTLKGDNDCIIIVTCACKPEDEAVLAPLFLQAASSVKLKK
jgi:hypothetical protein